MSSTRSDLAQSEQRYRFLADSVPQIIWTAKPDGNLDYYNQRWFDYAAVTPEEMDKLGWTHFVHPEDLPNCVAVWTNALATGCSYDVEFRLRRGSDHVYRWHLVRAFPMKGDSGEIIQWVGTCTDIDDQLKATELLERTVAERTAELREVVEELESFSYSISHDLRAPLRAMIGFSDILKEDYGPTLDDEANHYMDRIAAAGKRMDVLIKDVLAYSRISRGELVLSPIDPEALIRDIIKGYPNIATSGMVISVSGSFPPVLANESALTQTFSNLISNAMKFGRPEVHLRMDIWPETTNGKIRIWFKDNGIGIARENHKRIFDVFTRVNQNEEGTGIGLSIVKKAMERMGGFVGVESEVGKGTSFWIELQAA